MEKEATDTLSQISKLIVDKQPPPDIAGKRLGDKSDPRDAGVSVAKARL